MPTDTKRRSTRPATFYDLMDAYERQVLTQALSDHGGDLDGAAGTLGLSVHAFAMKAERLLLLLRPPRAPGPGAEW